MHFRPQGAHAHAQRHPASGACFGAAPSSSLSGEGAAERRLGRVPPARVARSPLRKAHRCTDLDIPSRPVSRPAPAMADSQPCSPATPPSSCVHIDALPDDVLVLVFQAYRDDSGIFLLGRVCRRWKALVAGNLSQLLRRLAFPPSCAPRGVDMREALSRAGDGLRSLELPLYLVEEAPSPRGHRARAAPSFTEELLAVVASRCRELRRLTALKLTIKLADETIRGAPVLESIAKWAPGLTELEIRGYRSSQVDDAAFEPLAGRLRSLSALALSYLSVGDASLTRVLGANPGLTSLSLTSLAHVTARAIEALPGLLPRLRSLTLRDVGGGTAVDGLALMRVWRGCTELVQLSVDGVRSSWTHLLPGELVNLETVTVSFCQGFTDAWLLSAAWNCPRLRHITVMHCTQITDRGAADAVSSCPSLEYLAFDYCPQVGPVLIEACLDAASSRTARLRVVRIWNCAEIVERCGRLLRQLEDAGVTVVVSSSGLRF
eukprot:tig00021168_g19067.t1